MKSFKFVIIYLVLIEILLSCLMTLHIDVNTRMDYPLIKDNPANIDVILDQIERKIKRENLQDYVILLGDSVAYSGPGPSSESIGPFFEEYQRQQGQETVVFNLALPAMQIGDIYTMLLKLEKHGISQDRVILNIIYAGFTERQPDPPIVFWLAKDLAKLDPEAFQEVLPQLEANQQDVSLRLPERINRFIKERLALFKYKDFMKMALQQKIDERQGIPRNDALGDNRPWEQKEGLKEMLQTPAYQKGFGVTPFDMSEENPQIYFLNKIIAHQKGKQILIFMGPVNPDLMEQVNHPGYQENLQRIKHYFTHQAVPYIDFHGEIDPALFTDHVHLTAPGYDLLACRLDREFMTGEAHR